MGRGLKYSGMTFFEAQWHIWDRHHLWAIINLDLAMIELCIEKKKELSKKLKGYDKEN
jgi:hypothetical protein